MGPMEVVVNTGALLREYWGNVVVELVATLEGITRSIDLAPNEELCGFVLGGSGLVEDGVYGSEKLMDDAGVCDRDGALLRVA